MASSDVDKKFLGKFASNLCFDNPELSSRLYMVSGALSMLSPRVIEARKSRRLDITRHTPSMVLYHTIIWYAKEILAIIEQFLIPMTMNFTELKVLVLKLMASCYHLFVLFNNTPAISFKGHQIHTPPGLKSPHPKPDKGKGVDRGSPSEIDRPSSVQPTHPLEGGPVGGTSPQMLEGASDFLLKTQDFRGKALACFQEAVAAADSLLWGSHPLRLSVKVEYAAFLYDCLHEHERSRQLAKATIAEVYNAQEGMDDEMFEDAAQLVSILGRMMKRGTQSAAGSTAGAGSSGNRTNTPSHAATIAVDPQVSRPSPGMF